MVEHGGKWDDDDELRQNHAGLLGMWKIIVFKNIGYPTKEFKSKKIKWSDFCFFKMTIFGVENWLEGQTCLFLSKEMYIFVLGCETVRSLPSVHFFTVDYFEDVSPSVVFQYV